MKNCRICGGNDFARVIDLGQMPLVNNLLRAADEPVERFPLRMVRCRDCTLAQLTESPPPRAIFDTYCYFTSQSETMVAHAQELVQQHVKPGQRVVEIGSNDGYLLAPAQSRGAIVLGVEPARNISHHANACGFPTVNAYFNAAIARSIRSDFGAADLIFANNVLAHVPDPHEIVEGIRVLLSTGGVAHVEVPWIVPLIERGAFDTIYHEHQCYFSATALRRLCADHDLVITQVDEIELHGGSLHLTIERKGDTNAIDAFCKRECTIGITVDAWYAEFVDRLNVTREHIDRVLEEHAVVAGYGAAAKAVVMLNVLDLGRERVPWIADVSSHKIGRFIPGTSQPIVSPELLCRTMPVACLLFAWNLRAEVARRNADYLRCGGRFISSLPDFAHALQSGARS